MERAPTNRELIAWWDAQGKGPFTCADCGRVDNGAYVQPQHPFYAEGVSGIARCGECISVRNRAAREKRKADLRAMARCEVPGCRRRGTNRVMAAGNPLICGPHLKRANAAVARAAGGNLILGMETVSYATGPAVLRWAQA